ncbi:MAG TPA: S8 family serine peptidase [Thermodesulfovibrionales bacterium]|nr:S8 family serine peptidase [Thermodesulfovibrionales bacterium]
MKRVIYIIMALMLLSCGNQQTAGIASNTQGVMTAAKETSTPKMTVQSILSQMEKGNYREGELLVKFKSGVSAKSAAGIHQASGASLKKRFSLVPNLEHVTLKGISVKDAILRYMADPNVEYAEPNYIVRSSATTPNDTYFNPQQWALNNTGTFAGGTAGADIRMPQAWDITQGSRAISIAVVDTGIDYTHPDLVSNIWTNPGETSCTDGVDNDGNGFIDDCRGWNFVDNNNNPMDDNGHGTHVAGIIGAVGNNGTGVAGVMWSTQLMALKALDNAGVGTDANVIAAIQYAVANQAKVINASFGGSDFSQALFDSINAANTAGVLFIAAAGNDGTNNDLAPFYPASFNLPNIIAVAATDQNDNRVPFSNFGPNSVQVAAPGNYILSTIAPGLTFSLCSGSPIAGYDFCSGTSMSAPHVSGLAGLLTVSYADFTYLQVRATILRYVDALPTLTGWVQTGGRINAFKALASLLTPTNLIATATSSSEISLVWTDNATGEDGYTVERDSGSGFAVIATLGPDAAAFTDSGLTASTTYTYRVRAFNTIPANSSYSYTAAATTLPAPVPEASGGGSGCSIGGKANAPTAVADIAVLLVPLVFIAVMRRKR